MRPSLPIRCALVVAVVITSVAGEAGAHGPPPLLSVALPEGAAELGRAVEPLADRLDLYLAWPDAAPTETQLEDVVRAALLDEHEAGRPVRGVVPWVARRDGRGWEPLVARLPVPPGVPRRPWEAASGASASAARVIAPATGGQRAGALSGKHVYVSAGHGFTWDPDVGRWLTQRGNTWDIVEDLVSAESVNQLMVTALENAGATVWTVRERDTSPHMRIVDDAEATTTGAWQASTAKGFGPSSGEGGTWVGDVNPFTRGGTQVAAATGGAPSASMTWAADVPAAGDYGVYVSWSASGNRVSDARFVVRHAGGEHVARVDQTRHGGTWVHLGRFRFVPRADGGDGAVVLTNDTGGAVDGKFVAADAVRFGGGMGDFARGDGAEIPRAPLSGRPRWEENARYHIQLSGAPYEVYGYTGDERSDDVGARSRYAAWQREDGEDAVYVAWHTNAPSPGRGTSTFVYGPNPPDGSYDFTGVAGSDALAEAIHDTLIAAIRARFDPGWRDRGVYSAYFGEINPRHNDEMPSALVEVAFHSTEADAAWLQEPAFRMVAARAFVHGIVKYFSDRDGVALALPPEPPSAVRVTGEGGSTVRVTWEAPAEDPAGGDPPTGYRVYRSRDGRAFDEGRPASGRELVLGVEAGEILYVRVTSVNEGGESFPSPVLAARSGCDRADTLVVMGFDRLDRLVLPRDDLSAYGLATVVRGRLAEANRFDYVIEHAEALAALGLAFDSAEATAAPDLAPYRAVDWLLGEQSSGDGTIDQVTQARITAWLDGGLGRTLLVSGAELAWDLDLRGDATDRAFLASLGAAYAADDAGTYTLADGLALDDGTRGTYHVDYPDVLTPVGGAEVVLTYGDGGDGQVAGVARTWPSGARSIVLGAPIEALSPMAARAALIGRLLPVDALARALCDEPPIEVGPELGPEPTPEIVEGDSDGDAILPNEGATAGRPARSVVTYARELDDGCGATRDPGSILALLVVSYMMMSMRTRRRPS
ncbi:MAG: N-acetylmuramoyl-L-alanine amidase [Deltaproteobacteria bacterium]|nr:N-acetylmuramoyl-L-alanine amidase [Deltaproteobacteria bacterium]